MRTYPMGRTEFFWSYRLKINVFIIVDDSKVFNTLSEYIFRAHSNRVGIRQIVTGTGSGTITKNNEQGHRSLFTHNSQRICKCVYILCNVPHIDKDTASLVWPLVLFIQVFIFHCVVMLYMEFEYLCLGRLDAADTYQVDLKDLIISRFKDKLEAI